MLCPDCVQPAHKPKHVGNLSLPRQLSSFLQQFPSVRLKAVCATQNLILETPTERAREPSTLLLNNKLRITPPPLTQEIISYIPKRVCVHRLTAFPDNRQPTGCPTNSQQPGFSGQASRAGWAAPPSTVQGEMTAAGGTQAYKPKHCCLCPIKRLQEAEEHAEHCRVVPVGNILLPKAADTAMVSDCLRYAEHPAHMELRGQPSPPSSASPCRTGRPLTRLYGHNLKMPVNESFWCKSHSYPVHIY